MTIPHLFRFAHAKDKVDQRDRLWNITPLATYDSSRVVHNTSVFDNVVLKSYTGDRLRSDMNPKKSSTVNTHVADN